MSASGGGGGGGSSAGPVGALAAGSVGKAAGSNASAGYVPFFEYHGIDPGAYYGMPASRPDSNGPHILLPRTKAKKSFASKLANQIDKLTGGGSVRILTPQQQNHFHHHYGQSQSGGGAARLQDIFRDPQVRQVGTPRTFYNVVPSKSAATTPSHNHRTPGVVSGTQRSSRPTSRPSASTAQFRPPSNSSKYLQYPQTPPYPHYVHPGHFVDLSGLRNREPESPYYIEEPEDDDEEEDEDNIEAVGNHCHCQDQDHLLWESAHGGHLRGHPPSGYGTQRLRSRSQRQRIIPETLNNDKNCRNCGKAKENSLRRTQSDESLGGGGGGQHQQPQMVVRDPYDIMRMSRMKVGTTKNSGNRGKNPTVIRYNSDDRDLDYAEADFIYHTGGRRPPPPRSILAAQRRMELGINGSSAKKTSSPAVVPSSASKRQVVQPQMLNNEEQPKKVITVAKHQVVNKHNNNQSASGLTRRSSSYGSCSKTSSSSNDGANSNEAVNNNVNVSNVVTVNGNRNSCSVVYLSPESGGSSSANLDDDEGKVDEVNVTTCGPIVTKVSVNNEVAFSDEEDDEEENALDRYKKARRRLSYDETTSTSTEDSSNYDADVSQMESPRKQLQTEPGEILDHKDYIKWESPSRSSIGRRSSSDSRIGSQFQAAKFMQDFNNSQNNNSLVGGQSLYHQVGGPSLYQGGPITSTSGPNLSTNEENSSSSYLTMMLKSPEIQKRASATANNTFVTNNNPLHQGFQEVQAQEDDYLADKPLPDLPKNLNLSQSQQSRLSQHFLSFRKRISALQSLNKYSPSTSTYESSASNQRISDDFANNHHNRHLFNDTTRLKLNNPRTSLSEVFFDQPQNNQNHQQQPQPRKVSGELGRKGISQSFKEKQHQPFHFMQQQQPVRPKDPPPPPPPILSPEPSATSPQMLTTASNSTPTSLIEAPASMALMYDIAEHDETASVLSYKPLADNVSESSRNNKLFTPKKVVQHSNSFFSSNSLRKIRASQGDHVVRSPSMTAGTSAFNSGLHNRNRSAERSRSFASRTSFFSHIPKSVSYNSLDRKANNGAGPSQSSSGVNPQSQNQQNFHSDPRHRYKIQIGGNTSGFPEHSAGSKSSTDLVTIVSTGAAGEQGHERLGFKDIRKILNSTPDREFANSTEKIESSSSSEHIYEEIPSKTDNSKVNALLQRPLPPIPKQQETKNSNEPKPDLIDNGEDSDDSAGQMKSIFEGATKYDILQFLEGAKERGVPTDAEDIEDEEAEIEEEEEQLEVRESQVQRRSFVVGTRNDGHRISKLSTTSSSGRSSSNASSARLRWTNNVNTAFNNSVEIERNDSGLGSETGGKIPPKRPVRLKAKRSASAASSLNQLHLTSTHQHNLSQSPPSASSAQNAQPPSLTSIRRTKSQHNTHQICDDCDQAINPTDQHNSNIGSCGDINFDPNGSLCFACARRRCELKEIITEIIETEIKYGRDLRIIRDEFLKPMEVAGLLTPEQLGSIFLNVDELIAMNKAFTELLRDAIELALDEGDEDLCGVCIGRAFLQAEPMLAVFKSYCTRQGSASSLLASLEKEKELLRIFLRVSQMENTILRRMNLSSFLMVPVQRVTKYPLLLSRLMKVTPAHHEDRSGLQRAREKIEHHLENINQEARDNSSTKLWRRISMINVSSYRKMDTHLDILGNTTWGIRKMALDVLAWSQENRESVNFVLESKLMFTQPTEPNWRKGWGTVKMTSVSALLVTLSDTSKTQNANKSEQNGGGDASNNTGRNAKLFFPKESGIKSAAMLLIKEKNNRYTMIRDPLFLDKCIVSCDPEWNDCFEMVEFGGKDSYIFKAEDIIKTQEWFRTIQSYAMSLGQWRRRRNALANIMINGATTGLSPKSPMTPLRRS